MASPSLQLIRMVCPRCGTALQAEETEIAWACPKCQQGLLLTPGGLTPITVQWAAARPAASVRWYPFWSFTGTVRFSQRANFGGRSEPDALWQQPRRFFIPAYQLPLKELGEAGATLLKQGLTPRPAAAPAQGTLGACTLFPADAKQAAEFVVLTIEAERKDKLKRVEFSIETSEPELWMLPFAANGLALA